MDGTLAPLHTAPPIVQGPTRLVRLLENYGEDRAGHTIRLPTDDATALIAAGRARGITCVRLLERYSLYNVNEIAGFPDDEAAALIADAAAELWDPPEEQAKALDSAPHDRMVHEAPHTKGQPQ